MSKYIIKMKDGSEQHVMPSVHNTLKEALLTLSHYITGVVEDMDDDSMEDPFNYAIEEVDEKEKLSESNVPFEGVAKLVEDINPKRIEAQLALNKLVSMAEAWNKEDGFVPDSRIGNKTSGFLGSCMTSMLRGSCTRLRITRRRLRLRVSVLGFASNRPRAPRNSASNSPTFTTRCSYNN